MIGETYVDSGGAVWQTFSRTTNPNNGRRLLVQKSNDGRTRTVTEEQADQERRSG